MTSAPASAAKGGPPQRPNILLILTDQQFAGAMSCAGNRDVRTPAMDSLAASGIRFDLAYCAQPLCSPARASLFTGLPPHQTGVTTNGPGLVEQLRERCLDLVLTAAGYECAYGGKWHLPQLSLPEGPGFRNICGFADDMLVDACVAFLRRQHDRPFLLVASFDNPHNICEWARNEPLPWGPVPAVPTEECPSLPANYAIPPYEPQILRLAQAAQPRVHPTVHFSDDQWRHYRHAYFRLCEQVDAQIGAILAAVQETGLARDTVIIFTSDHGDGLGAHRWNQKWALYEEPTRIPLIVSWPGGAPPGQVDHTHLISNGLDLVPTICDYAGIAPPTGLLGRSVRPLVEGGAAPAWPDQVVAETAWDKTVLPRSAGRMLRTARHKYVAYSWGQHREQLFDLTEDPGELVNLAVDAHYRSLLREHRERLAHWCEQTADTFRVPE